MNDHRPEQQPHCDQCHAFTEPVFTAQEGFRLSVWYCRECGHWQQPKGQQFLITQEQWNGGRSRD